MKHLKIRKLIKNEFVDYDYTDKLSPEDLDFLTKATNEIYCNAHGTKGSLHQQALGKSEYKKKKLEYFGNTNSQNRDLMNRDLFRDFDELILENVTEELREDFEHDIETKAPAEVMTRLVEDTTDEVLRDLANAEDIIKEHTYKCVLLYVMLKKEEDRLRRIENKEKRAKKSATIEK